MASLNGYHGEPGSRVRQRKRPKHPPERLPQRRLTTPLRHESRDTGQEECWTNGNDESPNSGYRRFREQSLVYDLFLIVGVPIRIRSRHRSEFVAEKGQHLIDLVHPYGRLAPLQFAQEPQSNTRAIRKGLLREAQALAAPANEGGNGNGFVGVRHEGCIVRTDATR